MILVHFQGKPFNITIIQVYAPNTIAEEAEADQFYEGLQGLLELAPNKQTNKQTKTKKQKQKQKRCPFPHGGWSAKVRSQKLPGVRGKLVLAVQNKMGQRLIVFANRMH